MIWFDADQEQGVNCPFQTLDIGKYHSRNFGLSKTKTSEYLNQWKDLYAPYSILSHLWLCVQLYVEPLISKICLL